VRVYVDKQPHDRRPTLETVLLDPDNHRVCMVWRASVPCDKKVLQVQQAVIRLNELKLAG
jgi:hypothetical protein